MVSAVIPRIQNFAESSKVGQHEPAKNRASTHAEQSERPRKSEQDPAIILWFIYNKHDIKIWSFRRVPLDVKTRQKIWSFRLTLSVGKDTT